MGRIEEILMKRDGDSREEAISRVEDCRELCNECIAMGDFTGVEQMIMGELGLEMDYALDILI